MQGGWGILKWSPVWGHICSETRARWDADTDNFRDQTEWCKPSTRWWLEQVSGYLNRWLLAFFSFCKNQIRIWSKRAITPPLLSASKLVTTHLACMSNDCLKSSWETTEWNEPAAVNVWRHSSTGNSSWSRCIIWMEWMSSFCGHPQLHANSHAPVFSLRLSITPSHNHLVNLCQMLRKSLLRWADREDWLSGSWIPQSCLVQSNSFLSHWLPNWVINKRQHLHLLDTIVEQFLRWPLGAVKMSNYTEEINIFTV